MYLGYPNLEIQTFALRHLKCETKVSLFDHKNYDRDSDK